MIRTQGPNDFTAAKQIKAYQATSSNQEQSTKIEINNATGRAKHIVPDL